MRQPLHPPQYLTVLLALCLSAFLLTETTAKPGRKGPPRGKPAPHFKHGAGKNHPSKAQRIDRGPRARKFAAPFRRSTGSKPVFSSRRGGPCSNCKGKRGGPGAGKRFGGPRPHPGGSGPRFGAPHSDGPRLGVQPGGPGPRKFRRPGNPGGQPPMSPGIRRGIPEFKALPQPPSGKGPGGPPWQRRGGDRPNPHLGPPQKRGNHGGKGPSKKNGAQKK